MLSASTASSASASNDPETAREPPNVLGKRTPSSSPKAQISIACGKRRDKRCSSAIASIATTTPRLPSKWPPLRTVSMCEPRISVLASARLPSSRPTTVPAASIAAVIPAACIHPIVRFAASLCCALRYRRVKPVGSLDRAANSSSRAIILGANWGAGTDLVRRLGRRAIAVFQAPRCRPAGLADTAVRNVSHRTMI